MKIKLPIKNTIIFGDSYSTFKGYIPEGYSYYYSPNERPEMDVSGVEKTWWHLLREELGIEILRNDSWSGSTLCNTGYAGDCSKTSSFIYRLEKLEKEGFFKQKIDTVLVFGCTNDSWADAPLGNVKLDSQTKEDLFSVCPAICYFAAKLRKILPDANIIFIINTGLKPEISETVKIAAEYNKCSYIELNDIDKISGHPTAKGMEQIKEQVKSFILNNA